MAHPCILPCCPLPATPARPAPLGTLCLGSVLGGTQPCPPPPCCPGPTGGSRAWDDARRESGWLTQITEQRVNVGALAAGINSCFGVKLLEPYRIKGCRAVNVWLECGIRRKSRSTDFQSNPWNFLLKYDLHSEKHTCVRTWPSECSQTDRLQERAPRLGSRTYTRLRHAWLRHPKGDIRRCLKG